VRGFLATIRRQDASEAIYTAVLEAALPDSLNNRESELLDLVGQAVAGSRAHRAGGGRILTGPPPGRTAFAEAGRDVARAAAPLRTTRRRRTQVAGLGALLLLSGIAAVVYRVGQNLGVPAQLHPADAIVVLGGEWPNRIDRGIALFQRDLAPEIWITGDGKGTGNPAKSAERARREGVPAEAIRILLSTSTWEDAGAAAALAARRNVHSVLVVTSWYHSRRALCVMQRRFAGSGVAVYHDSAPNSQYGADSWWRYVGTWYRVAREVAAFGWYWADHDLSPWSC
jgi:uncharacterized SAM-binding protein YcdF (DUF218 family)